MSAIAMALPRRLLTALFVASALLCAMVSLSHAQTTGKRMEMCWPGDSLAFKESESRIQPAWRSALMGPPRRTPIAAEPIPPGQRLAIRRVKLPPGVKLVALTFDLCEQPHEVAGYQGDIVDYLRAHKIRATFFAGGKWMLTHKDRAQQLMADPLFEIGNHSWEHRNLRLLAGSPLAKEIANAQIAYEQVREELAAKQCLGRDERPAHRGAPLRLSLFRFPFGACDDQALGAVGEMGLKAIQWDVSSGDPWTGQNPELMVKAVQAGARPGSIILFHANGRGWHTSSALPKIVQALKEKGYGFVTVSELLERGEPVYSETCYDSRPGDTDRYDKLAAQLERLHERRRNKILSEPIDPKSTPVPVRAKKPAAETEFKTEVKKEE